MGWRQKPEAAGKAFFSRLFGLVDTCCHAGRRRVLVRETFANPSTERSLFKDKNTFFFCFLFLFVELTHLKTKKKKKKQGLQVHHGNRLEGVVGRRGGGEIQTFEVVFHLISDPKMDHLSSGPRYTPASVSHLFLFVP